MNVVSQGLAAARIRVVRFEFPYMVERRRTGKKRPPNPARQLLQTYRDVVATLGNPECLVIGGKSMGGRMASLLADELEVGGLLCLGYPFHPPGAADKLRTEHLEKLTTPALFVQGERDTFGCREEVAGYRIDRRIRMAWMPDGDHSFKPRKRSGHTLEGNLEACVVAAAEFVRCL